MLFPALSLITAGNHFDPGADVPAAAVRSQLVLSLLSWAVVIVLFFANRWFINSRPAPAGVAATAPPHRVLVLANEVVDSTELLEKLREIGADRETAFQVVVPASPVETGVAATHGPLDVWDATVAAAQERWTTRSTRFAPRDFRLRARWVTTGHCAHWPPASSRSTPTRS